MELMQLEMFVAVVEERSFVMAAERVFRTQPAVSIGLRKLEEEVGAPLLDRARRQSGRLTPQGEIVYEYASRILRLRDEMSSALKEPDIPSTDVLRVGVTWEVDLDWIQPAARRFNKRRPGIRVELLCDSSERLFKDLTDGRLDLGVLPSRPKVLPGGKRLVVRRLARLRSYGALWTARRLQEQSFLGAAFEQELQGRHADRQFVKNRSLRVRSHPERAELPRPEVISARLEEGPSSVAAPTVRVCPNA